VLPKTRSKIWMNDDRWKHVVDKINQDRLHAPQDDWRNRPWPFKPLFPFMFG
jgi:hypothetical protein